MPKRFKRSFSRGGGRKRFRTRSSRSKSSAFRLKSSAGSRFKRFGKRFKRGGMKGKIMPKWFKTITQGSAPTNVSGNYGNQISITVNNNGICTHWQHLSIIDLQAVLDVQAGAQASSSGTSKTGNTTKQYIHNLTRKHTWRNSINYGETTLQFYRLVPRRDFPYAPGGVGASGMSLQIAPPNSYNYGVGGTNDQGTQGGGSPSTVNTFWMQPIQDAGPAITGLNTIINGGTGFVDPDWTPYQSATCAGMFKIKPFKVTGPQGRASKIRLQPGQECFYEGKFRKPYLVNYAKFGLAAAAGNQSAAGIGGIYQFLKITPLILCVHSGSIIHDATVKTTIGKAPVSIDYYQEYKYDIWRGMSSVARTSWNPTTNYPAAPTGPEMVPIVTAAAATVTET